MSYYFGFVPSEELSQLLETAHKLVTTNDQSERWDNYRDKITHMVSKELIESLLGNLVDAMPEGSERREHLAKTTETIEGAVDKLVNTVLNKASNDEVVPSFKFLEKTWFTDNDGVKRIGFQMDDTLAEDMQRSFDKVLAGDGKAEVKNLSDVIARFTKAVLAHFLIDFTKTLNIGMLKRAAIPIADGVIVKTIDIMLHRLIPQMPQEGLERYVNNYKPLMVKL